MLFHKIALRHPVNTQRFGKMPSYTHLVAYSGPGSSLKHSRIHGLCSAAVADVTHRGDIAWIRGMGVDTALGACRFVRDVVVRSATPHSRLPCGLSSVPPRRTLPPLAGSRQPNLTPHPLLLSFR